MPPPKPVVLLTVAAICLVAMTFINFSYDPGSPVKALGVDRWPGPEVPQAGTSDQAIGETVSGRAESSGTDGVMYQERNQELSEESAGSSDAGTLSTQDDVSGMEEEGPSPQALSPTSTDLPLNKSASGFLNQSPSGASPEESRAAPERDSESHTHDMPRVTDITYTSPALEAEVQHWAQDDPRLAEYVRTKWLVPPFSGPRNLEFPDRLHYSQTGQSEYVDRLLGGRTNGFFVEAGAFTGEALSNSLYFEKSRNWTGLLVEGDAGSFRNILSKRRHAHMLNAGLSPVPHPVILNFTMAGVLGGLVGSMEQVHKDRIQSTPTTRPVQCFPLLAVLQALNIQHVDYFSLDVEGSELSILETFPFDRIQVDVLSVEYWLKDRDKCKQKLAALRDLLVGRYGYTEVFLHPVDVYFLRPPSM